jgi:hypothetical protein
VLLFCLAALIEGFVSPASELLLPWWVKGLVAVGCSGLLTFYFVILGFPRAQANRSERVGIGRSPYEI